jgi:mannose-1-phosphate guanylyltransferase/mannose-6-phosphate isomerase
MKAIILAGGSGTRLFPLSRKLYPKQFIPLFNGESLFQHTVRRVLTHSLPEDILVVTNEKHKFLIRDQLEGVCEGCKVLVEPEGKNTLPAIYFGMKTWNEEFGPCNVAIFSSDHLLDANTVYQNAIHDAEDLANWYLVTFGIKPSYPYTGYGYIKPGERLGSGYHIERFVEKPDQETAQKYLEEGYYWNSGMFLFNTDLFFKECQRVSPDVVEAFLYPVLQAYAKSPKISVDYGIMEKTDRAAVVPLNTSWSDVGSFDALYQVFEKNKDGNACLGESMCINSMNNLIISNRMVATIGVKDMAIVDTKDVLLVCPRKESHYVSQIVQDLRIRGDERANLHTTVHRPWGSYTVFESGERYKIKRVSLPPGKRLSYQMHYHRSEHWVVVKGTAKVTIGDETFLLRNGESTFVPTGKIHRLENSALLPLEVIEVQIGEYIGEDDIVRFADDFERS